MSSFLGLDWGSSNLRVFHIDIQGRILERRQFPFGVTRASGGSHKKTFDVVTQGLPKVPVLICGMAGSANGWVETTYVNTPLVLAELVNSCVSIQDKIDREGYIIPGLQHRGAFTDVMRGEETQLLGLEREGWVCLPGTHSKWAYLQNGHVQSFRTYMTGEMFSLLSKEGLIASLMKDGAFDPKSFASGVLQSKDTENLLHLLFSARSRTVSGELSRTSVSDYLSGLLIGTEMISIRNQDSVSLIGEGLLLERYRTAFSILYPTRSVHSISSDEVVVRGLTRIWKEIHG